MHDIEIWITVTAQDGAQTETMCTLVARRAVPLCPRKGEHLSFHQGKGSDIEFKLVSALGPLRHNTVTVVVVDVHHYWVKDEGKHHFATALRCSEIPAASRDDAKAIVTFMISQADFAVDPYGVNALA
jgi:hypothetical protein